MTIRLKECIFCGGTPLTREHLFGDSMRNFVTPGRAQSRDLLTGRQISDVRSPFDVKLKRVCNSCNNGWMNRLDEAARSYIAPMITGESVVLEQTALTSIAAAMGKIALLRGFVQTAYPSATVEDLRTMYETRLPPKRWRMWIGTVDNISFQDRFHQTAMVTTHDNEPLPPTPQLPGDPFDDRVTKLFAHLLGLDKFFVLTVGASHDDLAADGLRGMFDHTIAFHGIPLIPVWPAPPKRARMPISEPIPAHIIAELSAVVGDYNRAISAKFGHL